MWADFSTLHGVLFAGADLPVGGVPVAHAAAADVAGADGVDVVLGAFFDVRIEGLAGRWERVGGGLGGGGGGFVVGWGWAVLGGCLVSGSCGTGEGVPAGLVCGGRSWATGVGAGVF